MQRSMGLLCIILVSQIGAILSLHVDPPTLKPSKLQTFSDGNEKKYYRYISIDQQDKVVYVGAMEYVYRLEANNISQGSTRSGVLRAPSDAEDDCSHNGKPAYECRNHIRAIVPESNKIYVCGTGAFDPVEMDLSKNDMTLAPGVTIERGTGTSKCPFDPNDNATCIFVADGYPDNSSALYSGTVSDFSKSDPIIFRPGSASSKLLRTQPKDTKSLYDANFVGSFDVGDYVFFFFRETAIEYTNCGKAIYSRVARVCKKDKGGDFLLDKRWTTYLKARLNCSIAGEFPFYFNEIHDVVRIGSTFYGVFTTNINGLYGSAVCAFTEAAIDTAFNGPFKEQTNPTSYWLPTDANRVPKHRPGQCPKNGEQADIEMLQFIKARPLMHEAVAPEGHAPLFYEPNIVFTKIAIDMVTAKDGKDYTVFFLATNQGQIWKVSSWKENAVTKYNVLAKWKPFDDRVVQIWSMKLYAGQLYLGTDEKVVQLNVAQCEDYEYCNECISDPHCGYDPTWTHQCKVIGNRGDLVQNVDGQGDESCQCFSMENSTVTVTVLPTDRDGSPPVKHVRVPGDPVHLPCTSRCRPMGNIQWMRNNEVLNIDYTKYVITQENGLVVLNATQDDAGVYQCFYVNSDSGKREVVMAKWSVTIPGCTDPACAWKEEFRSWCNAFDSYQKGFNHWTCLKDECVKGPGNCEKNQLEQKCSNSINALPGR